MLRRLSADDARFKSVEFSPGLNLLVADTTSSSAETDSRNSAGKSSVIELVHFLLGAQSSKSLATNRALRHITFSLALDWPGQDDPLEVRRRGDSPKVVSLSRDVSGVSDDMLFTDSQEVELSVDQWNRVIERDLFGLQGDHPGVSGRTLFLIRRVSAHGFNEPTRTFSRQAGAEASSNLAYLLGLDWQLVNGYRELNARKATRDQLRKAVNDPVWGRIVGSTADLRGQITLAKAQVERLRAQVAAFQVVPEYERLKERADQVSRRIKQLAQEDVIDQHNLEELRDAVTETTDVEVSYLEPAYRELGVILNEQVRRRFEDVKAFHHSVVRNRRRFLEEEIQELTERLAARRQERADLGEDQARLLRELADGGALEALTALQTALGREEAALGALRHRFDAAQALEASARQITAKSVELQQAVDLDLRERRRQTDEAILLFSRYAQRLYGEGREAYLAIEAGRSSLSITPRIDADDSRGINNMVIFCFDLTLAVLAHRHGRGPDFLIHDSHLYDGVDERQVARALALAAEVTDEEHMQYIVTLNTDTLGTATQRGFNPERHIRSPRLTDDEEGGLFGFRFKAAGKA